MGKGGGGAEQQMETAACFVINCHFLSVFHERVSKASQLTNIHPLTMGSSTWQEHQVIVGLPRERANIARTINGAHDGSRGNALLRALLKKLSDYVTACQYHRYPQHWLSV